MSEWWEDAPRVDKGEAKKSSTDDWWRDAPVADGSAKAAEPIESAQESAASEDWWQEAPVAQETVPYSASETAATDEWWQEASIAKQAPGTSAQPEKPAVVASEDEPDQEMVEIFLEEALELQEVMDTALQSWAVDASNLEQIPVLHRTLHTIKGGARMAGVNSLGDLSHAMESFLGGIESGTVKSSEAALKLAQRTADYIGSQIDSLKDGAPIGAEPALLAALQLALDKGEVAEASFAAPAMKAEPRPEVQQAFSEQVITEASLEDYEDSALSDSRFLVDSQLMTNSELLQESQLLESDFNDASEFSESVSQSSEIIHFDYKKKKTEKKKQDRSKEQVRVNAELVDKLVNNAGEVSIYRSRLEQQNTRLSFNLAELEQTVERLQKQLRQLEMETEAQILFRYEREYAEDLDYQKDFDPLEMDRFSTMQELSRALSETVNDLTSINGATGDLARETDTLLLQQSRVSTDLQDGLLRTRMVPISQQMNRLQRVVRQTARSLGKSANLEIGGTVGEMDRNILENIMGPLEHLLRNAVAHGIENPQDRTAVGKPETGKITLTLDREGTELILKIADDGRGLNLEKIRNQAIAKGLMVKDSELPDQQIMQFILEPGFSTATEVTQISGRGVGMDVVTSELKQLGGSLEIDSEAGKGSSFNIHLPYTLAISDAMLVRIGEETYAVPHTSIEGVLRATREQVESTQKGEYVDVEYAGNHYHIRYLGTLLGIPHAPLVDQRRTYPVLLVRSGESRFALQVDQLIGNRQIVVK